MRIKNISNHQVVAMWDSVEYVFQPNEVKNFEKGIALHFINKHPELVETEEAVGIGAGIIKKEDFLKAVRENSPMTCSICGFVAKNYLGLLSHQKHKHKPQEEK